MKEKRLNKEQLEAVCYGNGPLLIIAGAGSGKTTVITERIKYLILKKSVPASSILALTFTQKAALEMEERVDIVMPYGYTELWISTFHAFCDRILRSNALHIGLNPSYKLLTEAESILFLRKNLFKLELDYFRPLGNPNKFLEGLLTHFSRLKDEDINPSQYLEYAKRFSNSALQNQNDKDETKKTLELANAFKTYEELKAKEGIMDFSDLISNTLKLFRIRKNILREYQSQFKYILIDEFQDTNFAQNEVGILLAGKRKNITVVGDDDQAIYRWRGAAISNIIQFKKKFPKTKIVTLIKNYRSSEEILNKSYRLIQNNNPDRLEAKENISKKLVSMRKIKGEEVGFLFSKRVEDEAELVTQKIAELTTGKIQYKYKDIAILVRANDHAQPFVRSLERQNIPYQFLGPGQLFRQEEIKDLIAYLKVLYDLQDSTSLYRVLNMSIFNFESRDLSYILSFARKYNLNLFEGLENIDSAKPEANKIFLKNETKEKINKFVKMVKRHLGRLQKDSAGQILYYFLEDSGLLKKFINIKTLEEQKISQNLARFFDKLKTYEVEHQDASVFAVVDWIDLAMQMGESPLAANLDWSENNAVNILTVHSSKGLEFPVVFLINLVAQRFPTRERKESIPIPTALIKEILPSGDYHLEEERRLFYVGMTRAKDYLFLTAANYYGEGKRERKISPFVYEALGKKLIEQTLSEKPEQNTQLNLLTWSPQPNPASTLNIPSSVPITYLSYSQIQTFGTCPLHYKLKYLLKIPTPKTAAQSFGVSIHSTLRDFYQRYMENQKIPIKEALYLLKLNWLKEGYGSKSHEQKAFTKAQNILISFLREDLSKYLKSIKSIALEQPFQFLIRSPNQTKIPLKIGGRIDRINTLDDKKIEIIDYKTGNFIPDEQSLNDDLQLTIYALAATEVKDKILNKKPEEVILSLYYLEENKKLTTRRTGTQLEKAKLSILEKAEEISKSDFECSKSNLCLNCEYKMLCHV